MLTENNMYGKFGVFCYVSTFDIYSINVVLVFESLSYVFSFGGHFL